MNVLKAVSAGVALALSQPVLASDFSNTVFFGDSLTDSGAYFGSSFTTNPSPVWAELLAQQYGLRADSSVTGGTNYAQGGARVSQLPGIGAGPALGAIPITDQVNTYLTGNHGQADSHALYSMWAGANDIFFATAAFSNQTDLLQYLASTATTQAGAIQSLTAAGARYVVVAGVPDMGITPDGIASGSSESLTSISSYYNNRLFSTLQAMNIEVIPVNMAGLLNEVYQAPQNYGFTNVDDRLCGTDSSLLCASGAQFTPGQEQEYLFADGVHPTGGAHEIIADYVDSILTAGTFARQLNRQAIQQQKTLTNNALGRLSSTDSLSEGESQAWGTISTDQADWKDSGYEGDTGLNLQAGVIKRTSAHHFLGIAVHHSQAEQSNHGNEIESDSIGLSLLGRYQLENFSLNALASISSLELDAQRRTQLGNHFRQHSGSTEGLQFSTALEGQYSFQSGHWKHGPLLGLQYHFVSVDGYSEKSLEGSAAALKFSEQDQDTLLLNLGWQIQSRHTQLQPYARIEWVSELDSANEAEELALVTMPGNRFHLPAATEDDAYLQSSLGLTYRISDNLQFGVAANHISSHDDLKSSQLNISLQGNF